MSISEPQYKLKSILKKIFPNFYFEEEYHIGSGLRLDFYCPKLSLAFECQGPQHDQYNPFFFKTEKEFIEQKKRDRRKEKWCRLHDITLIKVREHELDEKILREKISKAWETRNDKQS